jgi:hypothetical protein
VVEEHPSNRRILRPAGCGEPRQEQLLFDTEVKLGLRPPELEEHGLCLAGIVSACSA